jgi:hypothetical protein
MEIELLRDFYKEALPRFFLVNDFRLFPWSFEEKGTKKSFSSFV